MPSPRYTQIDIEATSYYHCISRCVRRAFLCGEDHLSGRNFDHRKAWLVDKLAELAAIFAIRICAYSVLSNHFHLVLYIDGAQARAWSDAEVVARYGRLFPHAAASCDVTIDRAPAPQRPLSPRCLRFLAPLNMGVLILATEQLTALRLHGMRAAWEEQHTQTQINELSFDERFGLLVEAEHLYRDNLRLTRLLREAKLKLSQACVEDIEYSARRELDRAVIRQLATCRWVREHHNILISGPTGAGKSYVACALAQQACRHGFRALYRRATRLRDELILAHADGSYARLLARFERIDVLIIDDWGNGITQEQERNDLLEIIDDRHGSRSTIVASQLPIDKWHARIGDPTIADAILDRLFHNAHRIVLKGASRRKGTVKIDAD